ncbi:hypothetical protein [Pedobacter alpinus]|uniref:hypothetical protein n=1 Tax=Pedobacter alpinus TaxID=1590643 RepID=UPI00366FEF34
MESGGIRLKIKLKAQGKKQIERRNYLGVLTGFTLPASGMQGYRFNTYVSTNEPMTNKLNLHHANTNEQMTNELLTN